MTIDSYLSSYPTIVGETVTISVQLLAPPPVVKVNEFPQFVNGTRTQNVVVDLSNAVENGQQVISIGNLIDPE